MKTKVFIFSVILLTFEASAADVGYDFYVYATSWQPEFCYGEASYKGCDNPDPYWSQALTIHGMWPEWNNGSYPATCNSEKFDHTVTDAIGMETMTKYWPNVKVATDDSSYTEFWEHEWTKHGTCSGLSQPDYFKFALSAMPATPSIVSANLGKTVSKADLIEAYGGDDFAVPQCESSKYLNQILNCVSIDTNTGAPQKLVKCPDVVVKEGDCGEEIQIATFNNNLKSVD